MNETVMNFFVKNKHLTKFAIVGGANTGLDFFLYFIAANAIGIHPVPASIISTGITMCFSFYLNHRFVFRSSKKKRHTLLQFIAITLFNVWLIQSLIIAAVINIFGDYTYFIAHVWTLNLFAKLAGVSVSMVLNFLMYRYVFYQTQEGVKAND